MPPDASGFDFEVLEATSISARQRESLLGLFRANYRDANPAFIEKSLSVLRHVAIARHEGKAIGFALGESRRMDLPRLPDQLVSLAGLACIDPEFRRRGLFRGLAMRAMAWNSPTGATRCWRSRGFRTALPAGSPHSPVCQNPAGASGDRSSRAREPKAGTP
jgi:GNAT superfamily N-acetyltransferase